MLTAPIAARLLRPQPRRPFSRLLRPRIPPQDPVSESTNPVEVRSRLTSTASAQHLPVSPCLAIFSPESAACVHAPTSSSNDDGYPSSPAPKPPPSSLPVRPIPPIATTTSSSVRRRVLPNQPRRPRSVLAPLPMPTTAVSSATATAGSSRIFLCLLYLHAAVRVLPGIFPSSGAFSDHPCHPRRQLCCRPSRLAGSGDPPATFRSDRLPRSIHLRPAPFIFIGRRAKIPPPLFLHGSQSSCIDIRAGKSELD